MIFSVLSLTGCITRLLGLGGEPEVAGESGSISLTKLERIIYNFADRDVTIVSDACEAGKRGNAPAEECRRLQHFKVANGMAVYDIVTSPNSLGHLVDLYVLIHLQHLTLVGEGNGPRIFGEDGASRVGIVLEQLKTEVDKLAELSMKVKRKEHLDKMIQDWRLRNPKVEFVSGIRFGNLPELSGKSILEIIPSFFDVLNPLDDTSRSVDETRHLAERAFFFSKRLPQLLNWQAEAALDDALAKPQVQQVLEDASQVSGTIDRVSKVIERVPGLVATERKELLAAWDSRQGEGVSMLQEIRATLVAGREFAAEASGTGAALERVFDVAHRGAEPAKPFDISDYTIAAVEIAKMARDANSLVSDGHSLLISPSWTQREEEVGRVAIEAVAHAERGSRNMVDYLVWKLSQILIVFFALLLLYRLIMRRIEGKGEFSGYQSDSGLLPSRHREPLKSPSSP